MLRKCRIAQSKFRSGSGRNWKSSSGSGRNSKTHSGTSLINCVNRRFYANMSFVEPIDQRPNHGSQHGTKYGSQHGHFKTINMHAHIWVVNTCSGT